MHVRFASASRVAIALVCTTWLAAGCSERPTAPSARPLTPTQVSRDASPGTATYLVLSRGNGFGSDFSTTVESLGASVTSLHQGAGFAVVDGLTPTAAATLAANNGIADVQADETITLDSPIPAAEVDLTSAPVTGIESAVNPTLASRYNWQWNMRAIHANTAWAAGKLGDPGVTVAILDTGMDYDDLDLNGLVDLSRSTSFVASDDALRTKYFPGRNAIDDFNGHGSNVAQQVSSKAVALAGVTSKTKLIGVKVLGRTGSGATSGVLNGILWAADHEADIASMSLGSHFTKAGNGRFNSIVTRVLNYANKRGMLIVVAAGNDGVDLDHDGNVAYVYCEMVHVVCVSSVGPATATGPVDVPAYYTNFGRSAISVAAPGGNADAANGFTVSAWPWANDVASWVWGFCPKNRIASLTMAGVPVLTACTAGNRISGFIGTSQATPHVAGLAALLVAQRGHGQPQLIKNLIERSADDLGQPGTDPYFGRGRINVARALGLQ
jgi:hypothetical protein